MERGFRTGLTAVQTLVVLAIVGAIGFGAWYFYNKGWGKCASAVASIERRTPELVQRAKLFAFRPPGADQMNTFVTDTEKLLVDIEQLVADGCLKPKARASIWSHCTALHRKLTGVILQLPKHAPVLARLKKDLDRVLKEKLK